MVCTAVFCLGGARAFLDPQRFSPPIRKMLTLWTKTDRGRKRVGWMWMALGVGLAALQLSGID